MFPSATPSSSYAIVAVIDKATSEFLIAPDWTLNITICDAINSQRWLPKEVVKAVKKRLQMKNPKVQLLALTLLETMVKNCGNGVHHQIVERNILQEMTKIVKKKKDVNVREKALILLSSWKDAFGYGGRFPQYYWAYKELRRSGVQFPSSSSVAEVLSAPSLTHKTLGHDYGTKRNQTMASTTESLSFSTMNSMRNVLGLLSDMLQAVNQNDQKCVKDEIMVDLVEQCGANQKKLMQLLTTTEDEELIGRGIELNDELQSALTKHDAITKVTKLTTKAQDSCSKAVENSRHHDNTQSSSLVPVTNHLIAEEEEEEEDFEHLIRRRRCKNTTRSTTYNGSISSRSSESVNSPSPSPSPSPSNKSSPSPLMSNNELILVTEPSPPAAAANAGKSTSTSNQDMIQDLLSLTLSTTAAATFPQIPPNPTNQALVSYPINTRDNYVVPWAHPKPQAPHQLQPPFPTTSYNQRNTMMFPRNGGAAASSTNKPYVPPYRLFEDLNVHGTFKPTLSGMSSQSMVGGRK